MKTTTKKRTKEEESLSEGKQGGTDTSNQFNQNLDVQAESWGSSEEEAEKEDSEPEQFPDDLKEFEEKPRIIPPEVQLQYLKDLFYDSEDSENERDLNTIGNVPLEWYDDYDHIGYDLEGKKIMKPKREDEIDRILALEESPWSVFNEKTGKRELISPNDMEYIKNIQKGLEAERYAPENWCIPLFEQDDPIHPTTNQRPSKRKFLPSKWELKRIRKLAHAIKKGWLKLEEAEKTEAPKFFEIWAESEEIKRRSYFARHIPAPKLPLPGHNASYNPPAEFLMDEEEKKRWQLLDPEERPFNFIPQKNSSLRVTPGYENFQRERFERCLDLYLAVRAKKKKMWIDPESLVPKIPKPSELKPFPTEQSIIYRGHEGHVRSIDIDPTGQWLASAGNDNSVRIWEISTGRHVFKVDLPGVVYHVEWNPNPDLFLLAAVTDATLFVVFPVSLANVPQKMNTEQFFEKIPPNDHNPRVKNLVEWVLPEQDELKNGICLKIHFKSEAVLKFVTWHYKGDYFATVCPQGNRSAVLIHQLSRQQTQNPFTKSKGIIQCVRFHPSKPYFFVATQRHIRIYNLVQQKLLKKLLSGSRWISSIHVHAGGDNVIMGSFDRRVCWFDLDLGTKPYKVLRYHKQAVRATRFHARYPLFASCSDDGCIHVFHGMVYNDFLQNAFIVPLKVLRGHEVINEMGVLDIVFHPHQPWIFSSGVDGTIRLYI